MEYQNSVPSATATTPVDPFLVEALQNPRHRLTILRMELDIQKFIQNSEKQQFEFQHFPTSYIRLAAHRVAQHYGLQTMVLDNFSYGQGPRILVKRLAETKQPAVCLSDVPAKISENDKQEHTKIVLKPRPKLSSDGTNVGRKSNLVKTVEERKEDYDRARARIFSIQSEGGAPLRTNSDGKSLCNFSSDENEGIKNSIIDGNTSRVAILRDREKDLTDPDYDRSYDRYTRSLPASQGFNLLPLTLPKFQPQCVQYDPVIPHLGQHPNGQSQTPVGYRSPGVNPYPVVGMNHISRDAVYMQWPTQSMMYAHTYDQFRHAVFQQAPFCQQQPLSFDYSQNR
ncbi:hypothetical protein L1987_21515 [Smallanthus sonchifolius]|uniref:Uncharacterized protein n=1 Tax=Smallanthus sonchifolius TaxID=185202 RepID=A0ACB9IUS8_9ASTR|nr:hypothetical protein L1987_21515 [Smallanthus sonchifolius]